MLKPLLVDGGQVVGTFRRTVTKRRLRVTLEPFGELTAPLRAPFTRASTRCGGLGREAHRA